MTISCGILLLVAVNTCHAQPKCRTTEMCKLKNTRGVSTNSSLIRRNSLYPASCPRACSQRPDCIATTYDPATETCDLHVEDADGTRCIDVSTNVGSTFTMKKWFGIPCPKVRHIGQPNVCIVFVKYTYRYKLADKKPRYIGSMQFFFYVACKFQND